MTNRQWALLGLAAGLVIANGAWLLRPRAAAHPDASVYQHARLFEDVLDAVRGHYVDSISERDLYTKAAQGVVDQLADPHSVLLVNESYSRHKDILAGTRQGIGLEIDHRRGLLTVVGTAPSSPAERAGLLAGDQIVRIEDSLTKGWNIERAQQAMAGAPGTAVSLVVRRGARQTLAFRVTRAPVHEAAVSPAVLLEDGIGYVALRVVSRDAAKELKQAVEALRGAGTRGLVLDLRGNAGGLLEEAVKVADLFVDAGEPLGALRAKEAGRTRRFRARAPEAWPDLAVAVLVDGSTASSAEFVTAALQENRRAVVVGTPTYGKGSVQTTYPLGPNVAVRLTTGRWLTPEGHSVERGLADSAGSAGLVPDRVATPAPPSPALRELWREVGAHRARYHEVLGTLAQDWARGGTVRHPRFQVPARVREQLYRRLVADSVPLARETFDAARPDVDRQLGLEITRAAFGEAAALRRRALEDPQVSAAREELRKGLHDR